MCKRSLLASLICAMGIMLLASRCSDDAAPAGGQSGAKDAAPADIKDDDGMLDAGIGSDPMGGAIGGMDDTAMPMDDAFGDESFGDETFGDEAFDGDLGPGDLDAEPAPAKP